MNKKTYIAPQSGIATPGIELLTVIDIASGTASTKDPVLAKEHEIVIEDDDEDEASAAPVRFKYDIWDSGTEE